MLREPRGAVNRAAFVPAGDEETEKESDPERVAQQLAPATLSGSDSFINRAET